MLGAKVVGVALAPSADRPNLFSSAKIEDIVATHYCDIRNYTEVESVFHQHRPEIVFHLAAQALVRKSYRDPRETFATNVLGTVHVLEAARNCDSVRSVVNVTTDKCYENREWAWGYRESDRLGGHDPYSASKACSELVTAAYRSSYFRDDRPLHVATARAGNVIGGGDWAEDRIVPDFVSSIRRGQALHLRNPGAVRPWQHVLDPLRGYLMLGEKLAEDGERFAEAWNFGPACESHVSVGEFAEGLAIAWGGGSVVANGSPEEKSPEENMHESNMHETNYLALDCSKSRRRLGWQPRLTLSGAIEMTAHWYRSFYENPLMARQLMCQQIRQFTTGEGSEDLSQSVGKSVSVSARRRAA